MAEESTRGRVVVHVQGSLAGLRALREAVTQARLRGGELIAVRTYDPPRASTAPMTFAWAANDVHGIGSIRATMQREDAELRRQWTVCERQATSLMHQAFNDAMGGLPRDVRVRLTALPGRSGHAGRALLSMAYRDDDLLVVAADRRRRIFRRSTRRYCAARASCPVLQVPPNELARDLGGRWRLWREALRLRHKTHYLTGARQTSSVPPP